MTRHKNPQWEESNQRYLVAEIGLIRRELEQFRDPTNHDGNRKESFSADGSEAQKALDTLKNDLYPPPAIEILSTIFDLSPFERKILLMCAGIELDSAFASEIASFQGDPSLVLPTFSMALTVFQDVYWSALSPDAPLRYWHLVEVINSPVLTKSRLKIDERILHYLAGVSSMDERLTGIIEPFQAEKKMVSSFLDKAGLLHRVLVASPAESRIPVIQINGEDLTDNLTVSACASEMSGLRLSVISAYAIPTHLKEVTELARLWNREAALGGYALFLDCGESEIGDNSRLQAITLFCESMNGVLFIGCRQWEIKLRRASLKFDIHKPTKKEQRQLWENNLGPFAKTMNGTLDKITSQFNLSAKAIDFICSGLIPELPGDEQGPPASTINPGDTLWTACCAFARPGLSELAQRIEPVARWKDLILPDPQKTVLHEIAMHVKQRIRVYEDWGFGSKGSRGLGISALFTGDSGTGKTMASEVLANDLKLDLYRIDLSQVVNKYIGETEKNLKKIFDAAEDGNAILLFDEADALFGKRSEVRDSHDRFANIEVSYLLQRMEEYRGLAILTTNMKTSLDKAFLRRIRFVVQFPFPDAIQRAEIWHHVFPSDTPKENLDWEKLARFNIAGGNIRNIAMNAAFLAANEGVPVRMQHISMAARNEYSKLEKQMSTSEMIN